MRKSFLAMLMLVSTSIMHASEFSIPIKNETAFPVTVTIISHTGEICSGKVAPTIKKVQQFGTGLQFNSIKYIVIERPTNYLPQIIRYPYVYEEQRTFIQSHTQHNAVVSWGDIICSSLDDKYRSEKSVTSTSDVTLFNQMIVHKKNVIMTLNGTFTPISYDKIMSTIERGLSGNSKKMNKSAETIAMILQDLEIMKKVHIHNDFIKKLEIKAIDLSNTLATVSTTLASIQEDMMKIDMMSSIIKKKYYNHDDLALWDKNLTDIARNIQAIQSSPVSTVKSVAQKIKQLEGKHAKLLLQINKLPQKLK